MNKSTADNGNAKEMRLTRERKARDWSMAELARHSGLNVTTISLIENRRFIAGPVQRVKLATALSISPDLADELFEEA